MSLREKCIEVGREAMGRSSNWRWWAPRHLERLFDLWEPMIRADEREKKMAAADIAFLDAVDARQTLLDMRAKVENLPDAHRVRTKSGPDYGTWRGDGSIWRMDVLALFEEPEDGD
jgi:hypothetical protein